MYMYMAGDKVRYVGNNAKHNLSGKIGEVVAPIQGEPNGFVVDFGDDTYVIDARNLVRHYFAPGTEPTQNKRRRTDDDD